MSEIYTKDILRLAMSIPLQERLENPDITVTKVSRVCGSKLTVDACVEGGKITTFGQDVKACAIGQACASIVGKYVIGLGEEELIAVADAFEAMVKEGADVSWPDEQWAQLEIFKSLHGNSSRYGSLMLPFECLRAVFKG